MATTIVAQPGRMPRMSAVAREIDRLPPLPPEPTPDSRARTALMLAPTLVRADIPEPIRRGFEDPAPTSIRANVPRIGPRFSDRQLTVFFAAVALLVMLVSRVAVFDRPGRVVGAGRAAVALRPRARRKSGSVHARRGSVRSTSGICGAAAAHCASYENGFRDRESGAAVGADVRAQRNAVWTRSIRRKRRRD